MSTAIITPLPVRPDFRAVAMKAKKPVKDPTTALRQRRARRKRKAAATVVAPSVPAAAAVTVVQPEKENKTRADVTVSHGAGSAADARV